MMIMGKDNDIHTLDSGRGFFQYNRAVCQFHGEP